jgi:hypothetical protein
MEIRIDEFVQLGFSNIIKFNMVMNNFVNKVL